MRLYSLSPRLRTRLMLDVTCNSLRPRLRSRIHFVRDLLTWQNLSRHCLDFFSEASLRRDSEIFQRSRIWSPIVFWNTSLRWLHPKFFDMAEFKPHLYFYFLVGREPRWRDFVRDCSTWQNLSSHDFFSLFLDVNYQCHTGIDKLQPFRHLYRFWKSFSKPKKKGGVAFLSPTHTFFNVASLFFTFVRSGKSL